MTPFVLFGPAHLLALAVVLVAAVAISLWVRGKPQRMRGVAPTLAILLLGLSAFTIVVRGYEGTLRLEDLLPLQLCDFLIFVAAYVLLARRQLAYEALYFWALTGTLLAMVTPAVDYGPPHWHFFTYFALHGGVVVAAVVLTVGAGMRPRRSGPTRAFVLLNAYAAVVGVMDLVLHENFLFLCHKPPEATLLDAFGPWPVYLVVAEGVALVAFFLLDLPFRRGRRTKNPG